MQERVVQTLPSPQVYFHALPGQANLLDLTNLDTHNSNFASTWLSQLLKQGQVQLSFRPDFSAAEIIQHFYFSARNHERIKGLPIIGFAYPFLIWSQGEHRIAAPLFIWQINLAPAPETPGTWLLTHRDTDRVVYNHPLVSMLKAEYGVDIESELAKVIATGKATPEALVNSCTAIAAMLGVENMSQNIALAAAPVATALEKAFEQGIIHWSGVIGFFPPQIAPVEFSPNATIKDAEIQQKHPFGLLPLDPYQASALQHIFDNPKVLVKGAAGTGKTHLLVHLLTNALSNGKRCLVVAENVGALRQIQTRLEALGLLPYSFLLQEGNADKSVLINTLRAIANAEVPASNFDEAAFRVALDKAKRLKIKLDENYNNLRQDIFGPYNWTETVGLFLRSNRLEGKELLASHLHTNDFDFKYDEYLQLHEGIRLSQPLYQKINTLRHPLSNLHADIFIKQSQSVGYQFVTQHIHAFLEKAQKLHHRYITKTNFYADRIEEQYEGGYGEYANILVRLNDQIADFSTKYGADFEQAGAGSLKLKGVFSGKYKSVLEARDEVAAHYLALVRKMEQEKLFDFQFPPAAEGKNIQKVRQNLDLFEKALLHWREQFPTLVQDEVQRLNAKNVRTELGLGEQILELENGLDQLVEELNTGRIYQEPFEHKMLTIPKRQKYLEEVIEQLENTRLYLREYDVFYNWQRHWLQLSENATKIILALVKVKPNDWMRAFESWYWHNCLNLFGNQLLTVDEKAIPDFVKQDKQLKKLLPGQIAQTVKLGREEALKVLRRNNRAAFTLLFDKKNQEIPKDKTLSDLLAPTMEAVTAIFPVMLATPYAVATTLSIDSQVFDYVLIDEAQYLTNEEFLINTLLGKKVIFFEESSALPFSLQSPISDWASAHEVPTALLKTLYRQNPGNVLQMTDNERFIIHFEQVDGRYDEQSGTNEDEAQHIIRLLNEVKPTSQRTFPTVGIVCFTIAQRDLIASYLLKIKQKWSFGAEKIQQLERNGLGVFYLNELRGQHFDILMVSTTYGIKNVKGELTTHSEVLNTTGLLQHLQLLMSRPLRELFIANSIPIKDLEYWQNAMEKPGYYLLANYLLYNQLPINNKILLQKRLNEWMKKTEPTVEERVFPQEVALALQPYLGEARTHTGVEVLDQQQPLLVSGIHEAQPTLLLQPDGFFAHTAATDYVWENQQREAISMQGFVYQPFWSINWWKNPRQEARKLAGIIIKNDNDFIVQNRNVITPPDATAETQESTSDAETLNHTEDETHD